MEKSIFRKSSLERISSPEQLNEYLKITNPDVWYLISGLLALLIAAGIWAFSGTIPETVKVTGVAFTPGAGPQKVYCYVPMSVSKRLSVGMKVQVSPDYAPREEYGFIYGIMESIGEKPVAQDEIIKTFGSVQYVEGLLPRGNAVEVCIALESHAVGLRWSNKKGKSISVTDGSYCNLIIVTRERRPIELVF